jgi:hypothetical protein
MPSASLGFSLLANAILLIVVVALVQALGSAQQQPQNQRIPATNSKSDTKELENNVRILEAAHHQASDQLNHLVRPDGPVANAEKNFKALTECQNQLQSVESVLQETQSKLIVLEHEKAAGTPQQSTYTSKANTSDKSVKETTQTARIQELEDQLASSRSQYNKL